MLLEVIVLLASYHQKVLALKKVKSIMCDRAENIPEGRVVACERAWLVAA